MVLGYRLQLLGCRSEFNGCTGQTRRRNRALAQQRRCMRERECKNATADAKLVCYSLHRTKSTSRISRIPRPRWATLCQLDLGSHGYVHNTYSERRQRLDDLARRRRPAAEVDDAVTFSEGDGHRGAGF